MEQAKGRNGKGGALLLRWLFASAAPAAGETGIDGVLKKCELREVVLRGVSRASRPCVVL